MCGIIWVHRNDDKRAVKSVKKRFEAQRSRGTQGFGFIGMEKEEGSYVFKNWAQAMTENYIKAELDKSSATDILFHHRFPTSTPNVCEATHPILVDHASLKYAYYVVHNGVISNDDTLKEKHEAQGYVYNTTVETFYRSGGQEYKAADQFNDSEALAIDLAQAIESDRTKTEAFGSIAFCVLQVEKDSKKVLNLFFGRNAQNPLKLQKNDDLISLTSAGEGADVEPHKLFAYSYETGEISMVRAFDVGLNYVSSHSVTVWPQKKADSSPYGIDNSDRHSDLCTCIRCRDEDIDEWIKEQRSLRTLEEGKKKAAESDEDEKGAYVLVSLRRADGSYVDFHDIDELNDYYFDIQDRIQNALDNLETARVMFVDKGLSAKEKKECEGQIEEYENELTDLDLEADEYNDLYESLRDATPDAVIDF